MQLNVDNGMRAIGAVCGAWDSMRWIHSECSAYKLRLYAMRRNGA